MLKVKSVQKDLLATSLRVFFRGKGGGWTLTFFAPDLVPSIACSRKWIRVPENNLSTENFIHTDREI